jgi:SAM-dependent methyltransferase
MADIATEGSGVDPGPLSRPARLSDWDIPGMRELMEAIVPGSSARFHRKAWEFAMGIAALERGGVLHEDAFGLSVGAGHEPILYYLTNRCRWLFATDLYGAGSFVTRESADAMLVDPDLFAPYPYRRNRLTVAYMDALDLRFEDASFDFVVSFGSIEHFGGVPGAQKALAEASRVLKPGGVAAISTELLVDGGPGPIGLPGIELFTPGDIAMLIAGAPGLSWLGEPRLWPAGDDPDAPRIDLAADFVRTQAGDQHYPHLRLRVLTDGGPRVFTSVALALVRDES